MVGKVAFAVLVALTFSGCSTVQQQKDAPRTVTTTQEPPTKSSTEVSVSDTESQKLGRMVQGLAGKSIYFDFDDFRIDPKYNADIQEHSKVLGAVSHAVVVIEGHADERGSREYNLALGQKRAEAAAAALRMHGILGSRIEAISAGKEKPRAECHEEKCWAENRRADFTYKLN